MKTTRVQHFILCKYNIKVPKHNKNHIETELKLTVSLDFLKRLLSQRFLKFKSHVARPQLYFERYF